MPETRPVFGLISQIGYPCFPKRAALFTYRYANPVYADTERDMRMIFAWKSY
jgi:hypothetical protein